MVDKINNNTEYSLVASGRGYVSRLVAVVVVVVFIVRRLKNKKIKN